MAKRPAGLIYGVEDRPAWPVLGLLALQHIMLISSTLVLPIVLVSEIGRTSVLEISMMCCSARRPSTGQAGRSSTP